MLFREVSINQALRDGRGTASRCCCYLSPSGRYSVYIIRGEVPESEPGETHFYNYYFIVSDFILETTADYFSTCGPFKRFHRFYYLNDDVGVLVDFSRNNGNITQNVIEFSHAERKVTCEYARIWNFNVDDMLYDADSTRMICSTALMKDRHITYLPLLGEKDDVPLIFVRVVPANPFHSCDSDIIPMLEINEKDAYRNGIPMDNGDTIEESDLCTDTRCYPLINDTSLHFIVRLRTVCHSFDSKAYHSKE
uniref:DCAF15_WD40 domain-containing protein n=1 Tax=Elaeophora elaphi TaxID=1147741 RepID=A0A0R3S098_9BILA